MKEKQGGAIIQMISDYAVTGANGVSAYGATMGGLFAMTNSFAMDYAPYGIRVNSILLGISLSAMGDIIADEMEDEEAEEFCIACLLYTSQQPVLQGTMKKREDSCHIQME